MVDPTRNWIKLHRAILVNKFWVDEPFTRGQAWVDLLLLANHEDGFIRVRGKRVDVKRGQVGWSQEKLAERWKWSRKKVSNFLLELEKTEQQIEQHKDNVSSLITITNYETFQSKEQQKEQQRHSRGTAEEQQKNTNKNEEEGKEGKDKDTTPEGVSKPVWEDFKTLRKKRRAPITDTVMEGIKDEAKKAGITLEEALKVCCVKAWQSFDSAWYQNIKAQQTKIQPANDGPHYRLAVDPRLPR